MKRHVIVPSWLCAGFGIMLPFGCSLMGWVVLSVSSMQASLDAHLEHATEFRLEVRDHITRLETRIHSLEVNP